MRATIITVFLITFALFIGGLVYRVDRLMFGDKLAWSEAQARAQMSPLTQSIEAHLSSLSDTLAFTLPQIQDSKKDYSRASALAKYQMVSLLKNGGGQDWSFDKSIFLEKSSTHSWAASYLALLLKSVDAKDIKSGQFAVYSLLSPERRPFLFILHQMIMSTEGSEVKKTLWFGVLTGPEFLQSFMDRSKGQISQLFLVNPQGQALAHTVPEYIGNLLKEDPIVTEIMKNQVTSGSGMYRDLRGESIQGFYEQVGLSNVFAVITTPVNELLKSRDEVRWQIILLGLGLSFVGVAVFVFFYRPEKEIIQVPVAAAPPPSTQTVKAPTNNMGPVPMGALPGAAISEDIMKEKMNAFMQVSSALAHELSGPLASILGHAQLLRGSGNSNEHIDTISEQARRSRETLRKLLTFAGEAVPKFEKTNIVKILDKCLGGMDPKFFRKGVHVTKDFQTIPDFEMPVEMIYKALESVINNAIESMERAPKKDLKISVSQKQSWIEIQVVDTGEGIDPQNMEKIFDPFYTSRKGHAGLGLSMTMGILKEINGNVFVDSKKGTGTTVRIMLNPDMTAISTLPGQKGALGGFITDAKSMKAPSANSTPEQSISPPDRELMVLDSKEVEDVLDGKGLEDEKPEPSAPVVPAAAPGDMKLTQNRVTEEIGKNFPPPPPDSGSSETVIISQENLEGASSHSEGPFTSKIDKPQISIPKRESKLDHAGFQIRRPGAKL